MSQSIRGLQIIVDQSAMSQDAGSGKGASSALTKFGVELGAQIGLDLAIHQIFSSGAA